jgi:hypothetical protein
MELSSFSHTTTRRLDDTYYSVLERLGLMQSTVVALKEVAAMSQDMNGVFESESRELVTSIESQVDAFGQFEDHQSRIDRLKARIQLGRENVRVLSERVDVVREKVEGWERADLDWQERTRKRLKVIWIVMSTIMFVVTLLILGARYGTTSIAVSTVTDMASSNKGGQPPIDGGYQNHSTTAEDMTNEVREALSKRRGDGGTEDEVLRAFDEL